MTLFFVGFLDEVAPVAAFRADVSGLNGAGECPIGSEGEDAFLIGAADFGIEDGERDELAAGAVGQAAVAALKVGGQGSDGGALVGGVKNEIALAGFGTDDGLETRILEIGGHLNGGNHVVADEGGVLGVHDASVGVDKDVVGGNVDGGKERNGDGGFVFAVAVAVAEDLVGGIGL